MAVYNEKHVHGGGGGGGGRLVGSGTVIDGHPTEPENKNISKNNSCQRKSVLSRNIKHNVHVIYWYEFVQIENGLT